MRRLILVRHAKAEQLAASDFDRPLTDSGSRDAALMARRLALRGDCPGLIVTSPALRARATAALFASACGPLQVVLAPELYLADPGVLLEVIGRDGGSAQTLMVVGHNPGISELAAALSDHALADLPTSAVVQLAWPASGWDAPPRLARLLRLDHPGR